MKIKKLLWSWKMRRKTVGHLIEKAEIYRVKRGEDLFVFYPPKVLSPEDYETIVDPVYWAMRKLKTSAIIMPFGFKIETLPKEEAKRILSRIIGEGGE